MKRILIGLAVLLLLSTAGYVVATWRGRQESAGQPQQMVSSQAGNERLVAEGKVVPLQHAMLSLPTGGIVATVLVTEGDRISAGQLLIQLNRARAEANIAQAQANLAEAQAAYAKLRAGATPEEIALVEAQLRVSQAQFQQANGSVTPADRTAAAAELTQAQAHLAELQAGPKNTDLRSAEAQLAEAQARSDGPARPALGRQDQCAAADRAACQRSHPRAVGLRNRAPELAVCSGHRQGSTSTRRSTRRLVNEPTRS